jgi:oligopeptide/dipeptide ABC transporter ATP-binding protein
MPLIEVKDLTKHFELKRDVLFTSKRTVLKALDGVSLSIGRGKTLGIVGESGCGKTTLGKTMIRLLEPSAGDILYQGRSIVGLCKDELLGYRRKMQIVFQDPFSSLDPRMRVCNIIGRPLEIHQLASGAEKDRIVNCLLEDVGLSPAFSQKYPHELSGGQRQRIAIARALSLTPEFIVADEPVTSLDVSLQAQILLMLRRIQRKRQISYAFISHDLSVVRFMSDDVAVMYLGKIVEEGGTGQVYHNPAHPYTRALFSSILVANPKKRKKHIGVAGEVPSLLNPPSGCRFHTRCTMVMDRCRLEEPAMRSVAAHHRVACHLFS